MKQLVRLLLSTLGLSLLVLTAAESAGTQLAAKSHSTSAPSPLTPDPPRVPVPTVVRPSALNQHVLDLAMMAAMCAESRDLVDSPKTLTIIDYSLPSTSPRLWVLDLGTGRTLYEEVVAHGRGSGGNVATAFSNFADSHQSSLGLFVTEDTYVGQNGYSMRLTGLEPGVNDLARTRAIVMHGAPYVDPSLAATQGRLGRSWGCPALRPAVAKQIIDRIKGGNLLFAYYPEKDWLEGSRFLGGCSSPRRSTASD